jgi:hypothetical protein
MVSLQRILSLFFKFNILIERLKQKKFVLSHTWINKDVPDINGRKRNFLGKYFQENRLQLQTFMGSSVNNRRGVSPNSFLDAVFIDYMDFPEGKATSSEVFPEEIDENCRNLPLFVLPTHPHYFNRSWCVSELLMNMLSGISPKVPVLFEIPLFLPSLDEEESCFSLIYDRFPSAFHPFLTLLFRLFGSNVSRKEDIMILSAMLNRTIDGLTVKSLSNVMKWKPDRCLRWEPECEKGSFFCENDEDIFVCDFTIKEIYQKSNGNFDISFINTNKSFIKDNINIIINEDKSVKFYKSLKSLRGIVVCLHFYLFWFMLFVLLSVFLFSPSCSWFNKRDC